MDVQSLDHLRLMGVRSARLIIVGLNGVVIAAAALVSPGDLPGICAALAALSSLPLIVARRKDAGAAARMMFGITIPLFPAILLFIMRGHDWQMDMHMMFFACLAMLVVLCDWRPIAAATLITAAHHLLLTVIMPIYVFNSAGDIERVILHAAILLVEASVLIWMTYRLAQLVEAFVERNGQLLVTEAARHAAESAKADIQQANMDRLDIATAELKRALSAVARGELRYRIADMPPEFFGLKNDFNASVTSLSAMIELVSLTTNDIGTETDLISEGSNRLVGLSRSQAVAVEGATAALNAMADDVTSIAERAQQTAMHMDRMEFDSASGGEMAALMRNAMSDVVSATNEIADIVDVIDKIAFQTNLLALNAGVEAARAGTAGNGFAVVAHEVRALSGRTGDAAKDVRALINRAQHRLNVGVEHVNDSAAILDRLSISSTGITQLMQQIVAATTSQSGGLQSISKAVADINKSSQRNVDMAGESNAAVHRLQQRTTFLGEHLARYTFDTADRAARDPVRRFRDA